MGSKSPYNLGLIKGAKPEDIDAIEANYYASLKAPVPQEQPAFSSNGYSVLDDVPTNGKYNLGLPAQDQGMEYADLAPPLPDVSYGYAAPAGVEQSATPIAEQPDVNYGMAVPAENQNVAESFYGANPSAVDVPAKYAEAVSKSPDGRSQSASYYLTPSLKDKGFPYADRNPLDFKSVLDPTERLVQRQHDIRTYLQQQYGAAGNADDLKSAMTSRNRVDAMANIGHGLDTMVTTHRAAYGGKGADAGYWNGLKQDAQQRVQDEDSLRRQKIQDYLAQNSLGRQGVEDMYKNKQQQYEAGMLDPQAPASKASQYMFAVAFPDVAKSLGPKLAGINAADLHQMTKDLKAKADMELNATLTTARVGGINQNTASQQALTPAKVRNLESSTAAQQALTPAKVEQVKSQTALNTAKAEGKPTGGGAYNLKPGDIDYSQRTPEQSLNYKGDQYRQNKEDDIKTKINQTLSTSRSGKAYQQAMLDLYSSKKAKDILDMYPDMNTMPPDQVSLLRSEVAKIAKGGVPDQSEMHVQDPKTAVARMQSIRQTFTNTPQGAWQGDFLQNTRRYLDELQKTAREEIANTSGKILMNNASMISKYDLDDYMVRYPEVAQAMRYYTPRQTMDNQTPPELVERKPEVKKTNYAPGSIITIKGKGRFKVGDDGDSLTPVQ